MAYESLRKGNSRHLVTKDLAPWLKQIGLWYDRYTEEEYPVPFSLHEQATVGLFVSAAASTKYISYNEYELSKKGRHDKRTRVPGRADFWMECNGRGYSFEVKRAFFGTTERKLDQMMRAAVADAECICDDECDYVVAALVAYMNGDTDPELYEDYIKKSAATYAYRFGPRGEGGTYLLLQLVV